MGGKGGSSPELMLPQPSQDNTELYLQMMQQQNEQNQQMMQMIAQMMMANQSSNNQPPVITTPEVTPYKSTDFSGVRDRLHEKATQNVSDEASNRTGRSKTIVSSPRLDKSSPATTGDKGASRNTSDRSLLSDDEDTNNK